MRKSQILSQLAGLRDDIKALVDDYNRLSKDNDLEDEAVVIFGSISVHGVTEQEETAWYSSPGCTW